MARYPIFDKAGKPTKYFWTDKSGEDRKRQTVFKDAEDGVKKMTGVYFDAEANKIHKE